MIVVRLMSPTDLVLGRQLSEQAGWNQTQADWHRFLDLQPGGCFVGELDSRPVGTVTTCVLQNVGWIGMLVVQESCRGCGVGKALLHKAIEYLETQNVRAMRLDATHQGQPLYERLGFTAQFRLTRFRGVVRQDHGPGEPGLALLRPEDREELTAWDQRVVGYERGRLLFRLVETPGSHAFVDRQNESISGYVCTRPGRLGVQIGPCLAENLAAGEKLLAQALHRHRGQSVVVDTPDEHHHAVARLTSCGLRPSRGFLRMCRGDLVAERLDQFWASSGPEKG